MISHISTQSLLCLGPDFRNSPGPSSSLIAATSPSLAYSARPDSTARILTFNDLDDLLQTSLTLAERERQLVRVQCFSYWVIKFTIWSRNGVLPIFEPITKVFGEYSNGWLRNSMLKASQVSVQKFHIAQENRKARRRTQRVRSREHERFLLQKVASAHEIQKTSKIYDRSWRSYNPRLYR